MMLDFALVISGAGLFSAMILIVAFGGWQHRRELEERRRDYEAGSGESHE